MVRSGPLRLLRLKVSDPIIYFAGVNQHSYCEAFRGLPVLESFADVGLLMDRYRPLFSGMVLDSGAFTELTTGKAIDLRAYADFYLAHRDAYRWAASLDSINGGVDRNIRNFLELRKLGVESVPTFHQGEPWELLAEYLKEVPRVGLGFQRPIKDGRAWLTQCFARIPSGFPVHGWAMTSYTDLPFESVDSTSWLWEVKALLSVKCQGSDALACLTQRELIEIVQKKYLRLPERLKSGFGRANDLE